MESTKIATVLDQAGPGDITDQALNASIKLFKGSIAALSMGTKFVNLLGDEAPDVARKDMARIEQAKQYIQALSQLRADRGATHESD